MRKNYQMTLLWIAALAVVMGIAVNPKRARAQEVRPSPDPASAAWIRNGIAVGRPKVFDNRTLTIMIESLSDTLRGLQFIDQKSVAAALGNFQGSTVTDSAFGLSVTGPSLPGISKENTIGTTPGQITTKNTDATGASTSVTKNDPSATSVTTNDKTTTTQAAQSPSAPTLANPVTDLGVNLAYGQNSGDLLLDQVNLTYQIFNLRMILERSLSDRLWQTGRARRQAVLGFNVSIEPPSYAVDAAAVVEVTIEAPAGAAGAVSLVAMMPQERTYNAAALNSKTNAFSGSAVSKVVNVGVASRRSQKTMYLYRDNDTIAVENMARADGNPLQFGWVFRPVLGRRSVAPGMRQMFAVIALPDDNGDLNDAPLAAVAIKASVRTYWKRYQRSTMTTFSGPQAYGWDKFGELFTFSPVLKNTHLNHTVYPDIKVEAPDTYDRNLAPVVTSVGWTYTGAKSVLVSLLGKNFFTGTSVVMGGRTYKDATSGLLVKSDSTMDILTDLDALVRSDGVVIGRYGRAVAIASAWAPSSSTTGTLINDDIGIDVGPALGALRQITIPLRPKCAGLPQNETSKNPLLPLVLIDDLLVSDRSTITCGKDGSASITVLAAADLITGKAPQLRVIYPFVFRSDTLQLPDPNLGFELERISAESSTFFLRAKFQPDFGSKGPDAETIRRVHERARAAAQKAPDAKAPDAKAPAGKAPAPAPPPPPPVDLTPDPACWTLLVGPQTRIKLPTFGCEDFDPHTTYFNNASILIAGLSDGTPAPTLFQDKFVLMTSKGAAYEVTVPPAKPEAKKPAVDKGQSFSIHQNDARWIELLGTGLQGVAAAKVNGVTLEMRFVAGKKADDKDKLELSIPRSISEKSGAVDITLYDGTNKVIDTVPLKIICAGCKTDAAAGK